VINDEINKKMSFTYEGEFDQAIETQGHINNEILSELEFSSMWLSVKDLLQRNVAKDRSLRDALRELNRKGLILSKTRRELKEMGIPLHSSGRLDEIFYCKKPNENPEKVIIEDEGY
jgi:hypothetical protein